ncbi:unnamed protein product [Brachionus calyciflorus]|uniref:Protein-lysine N-methyltransferase OXX778_LOCUS13803 n=1 Tax=Brachionus calyciflorus TaxID=104777 RepID=A0A814CRM6_9BILA|nr:unnamed protein product [Brachionus calyciflorus]
MISNKIRVDNNLSEDDDDVPQLSIETLKTLQEFYAETEAQEKKINENWKLSQFWYDKRTSETLAKEVFLNAIEKLKTSTHFNVACVSCPTLFKTLHFYLKEAKQHTEIDNFSELVNKIDIKLFEYDKRFEIYGEDFKFYDYKNPLDFDSKLEQYFDLIISDPPYLSQECHLKTAMTIRKIAKNDLKLIVCTGAVMEDLLAASLKLRLCSFIPRHERNLANEFKCYANYQTFYLDN